MARMTWLMVVFACLTFVGCGDGGGNDAVKTQAEDPEGETQVQEDLKEAGMSEEDYAREMQKAQRQQ
jgi:hypothetical protein